ncbi:689_t:CDS:10 [Paraglomus occultum]|uniref:689_t:CDS:1 n=1 Tax=Paraglomus occultum TaxID=144539 RepID=A0A9N8W9R4_9GLOM|nr:689_t:CDS:10 [Paraglomus occultum]
MTQHQNSTTPNTPPMQSPYLSPAPSKSMSPMSATFSNNTLNASTMSYMPTSLDSGFLSSPTLFEEWISTASEMAKPMDSAFFQEWLSSDFDKFHESDDTASHTTLNSQTVSPILSSDVTSPMTVVGFDKVGSIGDLFGSPLFENISGHVDEMGELFPELAEGNAVQASNTFNNTAGISSLDRLTGAPTNENQITEDLGGKAKLNTRLTKIAPNPGVYTLGTRRIGVGVHKTSGVVSLTSNNGVIQQTSMSRKPFVQNAPFSPSSPASSTSTSISLPSRSRKRSSSEMQKSSDSLAEELAIKRAKNTDAARRSRLRKVMKMESLEVEVSQLKEKTNDLEKKIATSYQKGESLQLGGVGYIVSPTQAARNIQLGTVFLGIGWALFAYICYQISNTTVDYQIWDPYQVLGLSEGTPLEEIKKHYKKLSLKWHPDKVSEENKQEAEAIFIEFTKAYKVLTDEETRRNYEEWGHPDGKQAYTMGIALPKWIVEAQNNVFVLGVYAILFGVLLPYYVGNWWYTSNMYTKQKILTNTMKIFFKGLDRKADIKSLLELLSAATEFEILVEQRPSDQVTVPKIISAIKGELDKRFGEKYEQSKKYNSPYCQKAHALLCAHLLRVQVEDENLLKDQKFIIDRSLHLINGLIEISLAHHWLSTTICCMNFAQQLVQAVWIEENPIVQLPHITHETLKKIRNKKSNIKSIVQLRQMNDEERKGVLRDFTDEKYGNILRVIQTYPMMELDDVDLRVVGEEHVTPGSIVTFTVTLSIIDSGDSKTDAKKSKAKAEIVSGSNNNLLILGDDEEKTYDYSIFKEKDTEPCVFAHAPYYPREKKPCWWIFIADERLNAIIADPVKVTDIVTSKTIKLMFQAPLQPNIYTYTAFIKCDSYIGLDLKKDLKLNVRDPADLPPEPEIDEEISEPDEESFQGQMKLMREQGLAAAIAGNEGKNDSSSDSDSD